MILTYKTIPNGVTQFKAFDHFLFYVNSHLQNLRFFVEGTLFPDIQQIIILEMMNWKSWSNNEVFFFYSLQSINQFTIFHFDFSTCPGGYQLFSCPNQSGSWNNTSSEQQLAELNTSYSTLIRWWHDSRAGNLLICSSLVRSFCSNQMSDCERFA